MNETPSSTVNPSTQPTVKTNPVPSADYPATQRKPADGLVGIFVIISMFLGYGAFCWLKNNESIGPNQIINLSFHDVASLNEHSAVFANGVRIGSVSKVDITGNDSVAVQLKVNQKKVAVPIGSRFMILANGIVGAKYIEVILPIGGNKQEPRQLLTPDVIVRGEDPVRPEIVMNAVFDKLDDLDISGMQSKLSRSMDKIGNVADHVTVLSKKMEPVADQAKHTADDVSALAKEMQTPVRQMNQILDQKHPLVHMMFGRPGHLKDKDKVSNDPKSDSKSGAKTSSSQTDAETSETKKKKHHLLFWKKNDNDD